MGKIQLLHSERHSATRWRSAEVHERHSVRVEEAEACKLRYFEKNHSAKNSGLPDWTQLSSIALGRKRMPSMTPNQSSFSNLVGTRVSMTRFGPTRR